MLGSAVIVFNLIALSYAQAADAPIEAALNACLDTHDGETTMGQLDCIERARASWDKRLNGAYGKLMRTLDPASKLLLQDAQRTWIAYLEKDSAFAAGPWRHITGTLETVILANMRLGAVRQRAVMLENYAEPD